jgi:hypothetical protein
MSILEGIIMAAIAAKAEPILWASFGPPPDAGITVLR